MRTIRGLFACWIAVGALFAAAADGPADGGKARQSLQWFETVPGGGALRVSNPFGDVYARFGGYENQVEILATIQKLDPDLPDLEVARVQVDRGLEVSARYRADADGTTRPRVAGSKDRVDLVLFVPLGIRFEAETREGKIEVEGLRSDVSASSVQGDIRIAEVEGRVEAESVHGAISAALDTGVTEETQKFTTETGAIEIRLWEDGAFDAHLATSGRITTDFSIDIEHRRFEEPDKYATATVGPGGPGLFLHSKRGDLGLLRMIKHF